MLVKLLPNQIPIYEDVIRECIEKSMGDYEEGFKTNLFKELLLDTAQCWISYKEEDQFEGVVITKINSDLAIGMNTITIVCLYCPDGSELASFMAGWTTLKKFGQVNDCQILDFYSDNPAVLDYAEYFKIKRKTQYYQMDISED